MKALATIWLVCCFSFLHAAQRQVFRPQDHRLKVFYGDTVAILADSAYIVSAAQALLLTEKLLALQAAQATNIELIEANAALLSKVQTIEKQVARLLQRMRSDHQVVEDNLALLLSELDESIMFLQQANDELEANNLALQAQLAQMDQTIQHLRRTNRRIAWQHTRDKVAIGLLAFGLGFLLGM